MEPRPEASLQHWKGPFFTLWTGQAFSLFGSAVVQFSLVWYLTRTTGSATVLATASLAGMLPGVVLGPFAGALVDRWNRRLVMIASDSLVALSTAVLIVLFWSGVVQAWHIYLIMFVRALCGSFQFPALQASTSLMVPNDQLTRVAGLNQALGGAQSVAAPPLGALLVSLLPMHELLVIDIATAALAVLPLIFIHIPQPAIRQLVSASSGLIRAVWGDVRSGFGYVQAWPGLMMLLGMAVLLNFLFSPLNAIVPLLVTKHFHGGAAELGWVESAWGIGAIAGGLLLGAWGGFKRKIVTSMVGLIGLGMGSILVGFAPEKAFWLAMIGWAINGVMNPIVNGPVFAIIQHKVAPDMQGRVITLMMSLGMVVSPFALMLAGPIADRLGIQVWYVFSGIVCVGIAIAGFFTRVILTIEEQREDYMVQQTALAPASTTDQ